MESIDGTVSTQDITSNPDMVQTTDSVPAEGTTEPVVTEPVVTEPVVTEPVVTEPIVTEGATELGLTDSIMNSISGLSSVNDVFNNVSDDVQDALTKIFGENAIEKAKIFSQIQMSDFQSMQAMMTAAEKYGVISEENIQNIQKLSNMMKVENLHTTAASANQTIDGLAGMLDDKVFNVLTEKTGLKIFDEMGDSIKARTDVMTNSLESSIVRIQTLLRDFNKNKYKYDNMDAVGNFLRIQVIDEATKTLLEKVDAIAARTGIQALSKIAPLVEQGGGKIGELVEGGAHQIGVITGYTSDKSARAIVDMNDTSFITLPARLLTKVVSFCFDFCGCSRQSVTTAE